MALAVLLLLLVIFVAQNTQKVAVSFVGWEGEASLAVSLLIAAWWASSSLSLLGRHGSSS